MQLLSSTPWKGTEPVQALMQEVRNTVFVVFFLHFHLKWGRGAPFHAVTLSISLSPRFHCTSVLGRSDELPLTPDWWFSLSFALCHCTSRPTLVDLLSRLSNSICWSFLWSQVCCCHSFHLLQFFLFKLLAQDSVLTVLSVISSEPFPKFVMLIIQESKERVNEEHGDKKN